MGFGICYLPDVSEQSKLLIGLKDGLFPFMLYQIGFFHKRTGPLEATKDKTQKCERWGAKTRSRPKFVHN